MGHQLHDLHCLHVWCWIARLPIHPWCFRGVHLAEYVDYRIYVVDPTRAAFAKLVSVLVQFFWRLYLTSNYSIWYSANGIALILGSLLAYGLANIEGTRLYTYQWIFLMSGAMWVL